MGNRLFRYIPIAVLILLGLPYSTGADDQLSHDNPPQEFSARVVQVEAGDIITILWDGRREKLRLSDIATPKRGQPFQAEALAFTSRAGRRQKGKCHALPP